jgi:hypothetical protein
MFIPRIAKVARKRKITSDAFIMPPKDYNKELTINFI